MSVAEAIRARDVHAEIVVVGAEPHGYYSRPGLAYYLTKELPEEWLFPFSPKDLGRLNVHLLHGRAVGIDRVGRRVTLEDGRALGYDRLLIATGCKAIPAGVPGAELNGVVKLDDMDDARDLIRRSRQAKAAVVVGGGITAIEIVEGLLARGVAVHYFIRKERYWSNVLSESESRAVERELVAQGVQIHYFTELACIHGRNRRVVAVDTDRGMRIPCDLVAVAIGVRPLKGLGESAGLECARGILTDEHLRTSDPDIFAAGDVAEVRNANNGRHELEILWGSAVAEGRVAGANMAGDTLTAYRKSTPLNVTRLAGLKITVIGTVGSGTDSDVEGVGRGDSESWRQLCDAQSVESEAGEAHVRLALEGATIKGAIVMGDQSLSFPLQELIVAGADVSGIMERLRTPGAPIAALISGFWQEWKARVA
jgi:NAD(P)H-nitrite reductase large subunit